MIILKCGTCGTKIQLEESRLKNNYEQYRECPNCLCGIPSKILKEAARICYDVDGWEVYRTSPNLQSDLCDFQTNEISSKV